VRSRLQGELTGLSSLQGFQAYIDHLFWFLPFSNTKQADDMLSKKEMSEEPWTIKRDEIKAKHLLLRSH
jgi:hypothetical protein